MAARGLNLGRSDRALRHPFHLWPAPAAGEPSDDRACRLFGAVLGWLAALPLARFASHARPPETRLAAAFLFLGAGTAAFTALLFALQYRQFYAQWHPSPSAR